MNVGRTFRDSDGVIVGIGCMGGGGGVEGGEWRGGEWRGEGSMFVNMFSYNYSRSCSLSGRICGHVFCTNL